MQIALEEVLEDYLRFKNENISGRYVPYTKIEEELKNLSPYFNLQIEGKSLAGRNIYSLNFGTGSQKVMAWSQMHGNETTTTKALFDFFNFMASNHALANSLQKELTFKIIPVLNPDGAVAYTRLNANHVDLNRDSVELSQPESKLLRFFFESFSPDLCLNLHGQRTIFSAGKSPFTSALSFLSPAVDESCKLTDVRKQSMRLINAIYQQLQKDLPHQIGRYDDTYNINCIGDYMQTQGVPTILFEAGHLNDYQREDTREMIWKSYLVVLNALRSQDHENTSWNSYFEIPLNQKKFFDIILRNCLFGDSISDIAIQYEEILMNDEIRFVPMVHKINDLNDFHGHFEIDLKSRNIKINGKKLNDPPEINDIWTKIRVENKDIVLEQG